MVLKAKTEAPDLPKTEAKVKALKVKKATLRLQRQCKYPWKNAPKRNKLDHYVIIKFPLTTESAAKKIEDNTLSNKHQIKQAVKKPDTDVAKVSALIRPDEEMMAYAQLAPDYNALDVANKI
ncbi:60S ribosomal protein L23A [Saguinus oedipus]|uniref:60S ribosomal protein L23A n=1 Tax=Saguinus oedipus TaxID=9490 RepID=A0ABQ9UR75_SAGOE|nr:60S ribosomal protein L23A [Saguinus oedipus]